MLVVVTAGSVAQVIAGLTLAGGAIATVLTVRSQSPYREAARRVVRAHIPLG